MCLTSGPPPDWVRGQGGGAPMIPKDIQGFFPQQQLMGEYPGNQMGLHQGYGNLSYSTGHTPGMMVSAAGVGAPLNGVAGVGPGSLGPDYPGMYQDYQSTAATGYQYCLPYPDTNVYYQPQPYQQQFTMQQQALREIQQEPVLPTKIEPYETSSRGHWWASGTQDRFLKPAPPPAPGQPKRKRRNSEKRKEKSRDAARCRRGKESEIFMELAEMLPLPQATVAQLDKASIMRLALAFLKTRALHNASQKASGGASSVPALKSEDEEELENKLDLSEKLAIDDSFLKALDGFVLIITADADVVYTSDNIHQHLGLPQVDVMGSSLLDYTHPCDHAEVKELVTPKGKSHRHCFIRLKCTLTQKGRNVNLRSATYKVCQISGKVVTGDKEKDSWVVATASPVPHPSNIEFSLDKQAFVSKHTLDMKFTYVDDNIAEFMGYECKELVGRSLYEMNHAEDSQLFKNVFKILCEKGQVETPRYRFLARNGGYVWLVTQATLINGPKGDNPQYVVCINYVVSGIESPDEILSSMQLAVRATTCNLDQRIPSSPSNSISERSSPCDVSPAAVKLHPHPILPRIEVKTVPKVVVENVGLGQGVSPVPAAPLQRQTRPQSSTAKLFTRRTEDMNKGYLIFSKDDPQKIVLKEEPDDLTHLAPCIPTPQQESTTVFSDFGHMFDLECPQEQTNSPLTTYKTHSSPVSVTSSMYDNSANAKQNDNNQTFKISHRGNHPVVCEKATGFPIRSTLNILKPICSVVGDKSPIMCTSTGNYLNSTNVNFNCQAKNSELETTKVQSNHVSYSCYNSTPVMNMDDEDMEARAPYIPLNDEPLCDEMLLMSPEDHMWDSPNDCNSYDSPNSRYSKNPEMSGLQENSNLAKLLRDIDPTLIGGTENRRKPSKYIGQPNGQSNKFLVENSFVDPNKVLHVFGEHPDAYEIDPSGLIDGYTSGTTVLMSSTETSPPPPMAADDDIDTPPPLGSSYHLNSGGHQVNNKRMVSPMASPVMAHKRICCSAATSYYGQQQQKQQHGGSVLPLLPVPNAPTMQQLLVPTNFTSDDLPPKSQLIGSCLPNSSLIDKGAMIDNQSGRRVYLSQSTDNNHISKDSIDRKGVVDVCNNKVLNGVQCKVQQPNQRFLDPKNNSAPLHSAVTLNQFPETNKRLIAMRITQGRTISGGQAVQTPLHLITNCSYSSNNQHDFKSLSAENTHRVWRRGFTQVTEPNFTIPTLRDLTQQDFEVNAPASNKNLLQGTELIQALDHPF